MLRILITLFLAILIPLYYVNYGISNFLWLSDIGLFLTFLGIWIQSPLMISMAVIGVLPFEIFWIIDFFLQLILHKPIFGVTDYMFDAKYSKFLRSLSFFHIVLPILWFWLLIKWGYDDRAFKYQTILTWVVIILTYFFTPPHENINWIFMPKQFHWHWMPSYVWLMILLIGVPLLFLLPLHILFKYFFGKA
ncbi:MAG: hypothetical protein ACYCQI_13110 [Gammaproteobacteria bacterium]